ncbi:MAG: hypothetical protein MJ166_01420 [Clostridia bacterium]|nr:hypothetical protein [Clostridia bacterium]
MSRLSSERRSKEQKKTIAATIGYSFVIVLIVLFVMSSVLSENYVNALKIERGEAMMQLAVSSSAALSHADINENMDFPLPAYEYDNGKKYVFDIFTKAGNSYLRVYSSEGKDVVEYTLEESGNGRVGEKFNNCFENQDVVFLTRVEDKVEYVCAIAPIISNQNTVTNILEVRMPASDFNSTVNGMSLSWIFTIFAIAVSVGIIIYEFNLLISNVSTGYRSNVPNLILYGHDANKFVSFFFSFSAIMQPVIFAVYLKKALVDLGPVVSYILVSLTLVLYAIGFFGFTGLRKSIKGLLTSKVAILVLTTLGYFMALLTGFLNIPYLLIGMTLFIAIANGITHDYIRDYRINASKLGYKDFDDRTVHMIQMFSYFLGISVGTVFAGILYERFGLLVVMIVSGACLILTAFAMTFFMKSNLPVRESYLPINTWMELITNAYTGKILWSGFFILGAVFSFLIGFIPNYLGTVGISVPTTAFYYFVCAFVACFVMGVIKKNIDQLLTSKIRILISSTAAMIGLLIFALLPTAKMLVVTVALLGVSLGIHDYTYLYILARLAKDRIHGNFRRAAEVTFLFAVVVTLPLYSLGVAIGHITVVMLVVIIVLSIIAFIYPISSVSNAADGTMFPKKKKASKNNAQVNAGAPVQPVNNNQDNMNGGI